MEKQGKVSFSIPAHRRRLIKPPAAAEGARSHRSTPVSQFITEFGPSETVTTAAAPAIAIAPLPNLHLFRREPCDRSSLKPTAIEEGIVFTREPDNNCRSTSHHAYGLNLPTSAPAAATDKRDSNKAPPHRQINNTSSSELLRQRFKQDFAVLSDHRDTEEYPKFSAEVFAAAVLAGYGWSEGQGIGRKHRKKEDAQVFSGGRRPGTRAQRQTFGLGYNPTEISEAGKKRKREDIREQRRVSSVRPRRS